MDNTLVSNGWLDKLIQEQTELQSKLGELSKFMDNEEAMNLLDIDDSTLLAEQEDLMISYSAILASRITKAQLKGDLDG